MAAFCAFFVTEEGERRGGEGTERLERLFNVKFSVFHPTHLDKAEMNGAQLKFSVSDRQGGVGAWGNWRVHPMTTRGWKRVPATRLAMPTRSRWPSKTLTMAALENSGRLAWAPLRSRPSA